MTFFNLVNVISSTGLILLLALVAMELSCRAVGMYMFMGAHANAFLSYYCHFFWLFCIGLLVLEF